MYDIYHEIDNLVKELKIHGMEDFADILSHRVHKVSWTSSSELFEELNKQIDSFVIERNGDISESISMQLSEIKDYLRRYL